MREIYIVVRSFQNDANLAKGTTTAIKGFSVKIFKLTWTRRDDFVLFLFFPRPSELLSVPSTGWVESFSTLPTRIFSFSASSSTRSFELRTVWSSSSIDLWQAARPVINRRWRPTNWTYSRTRTARRGWSPWYWIKIGWYTTATLCAGIPIHVFEIRWMNTIWTADEFA